MYWWAWISCYTFSIEHSVQLANALPVETATTVQRHDLDTVPDQQLAQLPDFVQAGNDKPEAIALVNE